MANPSLRSVSSNVTDTDASSIVCTHPSGLTVGDLMVLFVGNFSPGNDRTITTPTDWTVLSSTTMGAGYRFNSYRKIATSGDVSAGSTTVSFSGTADKLGYGMLAITNTASGNEITLFEGDSSITPSGTTITATTALTPLVSESMVISAFYAKDLDLAATLTASSFSLTPTTTLTERIDAGVRDAVSDGFSLFIATGDYNGSTEITSRSVTVGESITGACASICILVNAPQNATGTNALHSVSPTQFNQNGTAGTTGTNSLHEVSPTQFVQSGRGETTPVWTNPGKSATSWNNPNK